MKKFKLYTLALFALTILFSCEKDSDMLTGDAETGGLLTVNSGLIGYVVGNGNTFEYAAKVTLFQGAVKTTKIEIYKSFTNIDSETSNEVLLKTIDVSASPQNQVIDFAVSYNDLIEGLTVGGNPIPSDDSLLNIGDSWILKYVTTTSDGKIHVNSKTTKIAVGTRFAGTYKVIQGEYWRIGVYRPDVAWVGDIRVIESVDATTYKFLEWAGPFSGATNTHYFTISNSGVVRTPLTYDGEAQLLNGFGVINCEDTPGDIPNACGFNGPQNTIVKDDVNGKDRIYRTYGYYTTGSGPREIYEVLEKIVE